MTGEDVKNLMFAASIIMAVLLVSTCIGQSNPYQMEVGSKKVTFRADLDKAKDVPLSPDSSALQNLLADPNVRSITLAYVPDNSTNGFYTVTGFELSYKIVLIEGLYNGGPPEIKSVALNSTDEAYSMSTAVEPVILMKAGADKTGVTIDGNVVLVEGKDMTENGRAYTDLDLAADKLLLSLMPV
jgi:hypothetical protein